MENAQCEIDGGFENARSVVIMEAKNVVHSDFHVRQLYYPYRLWRTRVKKPIRLVFSVYSNLIYRLFEYRFADPEDYSSIELVQAKNYSLQDTRISLRELREVRERTAIRTDDDMDDTSVPFIQANSMERIISLLENLYGNPMTPGQISELMDFDLRQSDYYYNAGRYLGIVIAQIALSGSCYPYFRGVGTGRPLRHMDMDRFQRLVLVGPEIDPVRAYLIAIQLLDAWTTSLDCISQICRLVHRGRLSCDKNLRHFRPLPLWRIAGSDEQ